MTFGGPCSSWHAVDGTAVQCELAAGHPPPHATEMERPTQRRPRPLLVTWKHDRGRAAAEVDAAAQRLMHEGGGGRED